MLLVGHPVAPLQPFSLLSCRAVMGLTFISQTLQLKMKYQSTGI